MTGLLETTTQIPNFSCENTQVTQHSEPRIYNFYIQTPDTTIPMQHVIHSDFKKLNSSKNSSNVPPQPMSPQKPTAQKNLKMNEIYEILKGLTEEERAEFFQKLK